MRPCWKVCLYVCLVLAGCTGARPESIPVPPPANVTVIAGPGQNMASLSWDPVSGAVAYNVYYANQPGITRENVTALSGGGVQSLAIGPFIQGGLTAGNTVYYRVSAVFDNLAETDLSIEVSVLPYGAPAQLALTVAPSQVEYDSILWSAFRVDVLDAVGTVVQNDNSTQVQLDMVTGTGAFTGLTLRPASNGMVVFSNLSYDTVEVIELGVSSTPPLPFVSSNMLVDVQAKYIPPPGWYRASVSTTGAEANGDCSEPVLSADGRIVLFRSTATNLATGPLPPGSGSGWYDDHQVYIHDRVTRETKGLHECIPNLGTLLQVYSYTITDNGRFVVFETTMSLVPDDQLIDPKYPSQPTTDIYSIDLQNGSIQRLTPDHGAIGTLKSTIRSMTPDGSELIQYRNGGFMIVLNLLTGSEEVIGPSPTGKFPMGSHDGDPAISANGRYVSWSTSQMFDYFNVTYPYSTYGIVVWDRSTRTLLPASVSSTGEFGNSYSSDPTIGNNGVVAFRSTAWNLVPLPNVYNWGNNICTHSLSTGTTELLSLDVAGNTIYDYYSPVISRDGTKVAFYGRDLTPDDTDGEWDVYVYDRPLDTMTCVTLFANNGWGYLDPAFNADATQLAIRSPSNLYVIGDTNGKEDIFIGPVP